MSTHMKTAPENYDRENQYPRKFCKMFKFSKP